MSLPLCLCGCGQRVKTSRRKYASHACVPRDLRANAARAGRARLTFKWRVQKFGLMLNRAIDGKRVRREELLAVMNEAYQWGYHNGWHCISNRLRRQGLKAA